MAEAGREADDEEGRLPGERDDGMDRTFGGGSKAKQGWGSLPGIERRGMLSDECRSSKER